MDKLTVFDFLAFLIPGAALNGGILLLLYANRIKLGSFVPEDQSIINSLAFLGISYVIGLIVSEFAFRGFDKGKNFIADNIIAINDELFLKKINKQSIDKLELNFENPDGTINEKLLGHCFSVWIETLSVHTSYGLTTVLHGQFSLFRNLILVSILLLCSSLVIYFAKYQSAMFYQAGFYISIVGFTALFFLSKFIYRTRYLRYIQVAIHAIYSYLHQPKKI